MEAHAFESDASSSPDTPHLAAIGKALGRLRQQFAQAYLDDHKLVVDDGSYDESYIQDLKPDEQAKLCLTPQDRPRKGKYKKDDDSDQPWSARYQKRKQKAQRHKNMADAFELTGNPEQDMMVDPSEFPRILDLIHAKQHLDKAHAAFLDAFDLAPGFSRNRKLMDMLGHLNDLDQSLMYTKTDPDSDEKIIKGPLAEYKMDGEIIAKALSEISVTLNDHLGIKNQLANELKDDQLLGPFLR